MRFKTSLKDWKEVLSNGFWTSEEAEKELLQPLMLSYYYLPSPLKRCFSFCAFFLKDHKIDADNLIKLWMAHGYIESTENEEMETTGQKYLQNVAMRSFFQEVEKGEDGKTILKFKIHDVVHDFAQYLTKNECSLFEVNSHLVRKMESSSDSEDAHFPTSIPNVEKLHSFWVQCFYDSPPILIKLDRVESDLLSKFIIISRENNGEEVTRSIADLNSLNNLRGHLKVEGLGYAADAEEAKKAEMQITRTPFWFALGI